jgi:hypothetical protein
MSGERMKCIPVALTLILAAATLASIPGCSSSGNSGSTGSALTGNTTESANRLPNEQPGIRGVITKADSTVGSSYILVEEDPADAGGSQKASVRLNGQAKIYQRSGSSLEEISQTKLAAGKKVSVWFEGPVAESSPVQGSASVVVLEE